MHIISLKTLRTFWELHAHAEEPLRAWYKDMHRSSYRDLGDLRVTYPSADYVAKGELTIFNVGGNKYRLVAFMRYNAQTVFIKHVMTHAEYDRWNSRGRPS